MKLLVIVPINNTSVNEEILKSVKEVAAPDVEIDIANITEGSAFIQSRYDLANNAPHVIKLAQKAEKDGYDGVFVTDMDMCGVEASREVINIPIIGGFRANAYTAMMLAQKFSIITILDSVKDLQLDHIRDFGIVNNFASIRVINIPVGELSDKSQAITRVYEESLKCIEEDGANAIILGCTGFVDVAKPVQELLKNYGKPVPVLDPNQLAISYLDLLVRNKLIQSRLTYVYQDIKVK